MIFISNYSIIIIELGSIIQEDMKAIENDKFVILTIGIENRLKCLIIEKNRMNVGFGVYFISNLI